MTSKKEVTYCLSSLLNLDYFAVMIFPLGLRKHFFSLHRSFKKHVLQFVLEFGIPELICPKEGALRGVCVCVCVSTCVRVCTSAGSVPSDCLLAAGLGPHVLYHSADSESSFLL